VLPEDAEVAAWLPRLGAAPADAVDLFANRPTPDRYAAIAESREELLAGIGVVAHGLLWPDEPGEGTFRYAWVLLSALPAIREYHQRLGVPEEVSWHTLADFGLQLARHRRMHGIPGLASADWLTLHFRGLLYRLGRLQFQRIDEPDIGQPALAVHIPADGRLSLQLCDASFAWAPKFYARYYPDEPYRLAICHSWLIDDQLARYLPEDANIIRFQRRFWVPGEAPVSPADLTVLKFVFDRPETPLRPGELDALPQRTTLERAVVTHLRDGGHWFSRTGWCDL
jgi:hypothetical protein